MSATEVRLRDEMRGRGEHEVVWRLHLAPELVPRQESRSAISAGPLLVRVHDSDDRGELSVLPAGTGDGKTSVRFGELRPSAQVVYRRRGRLPMEINTSMTFTSNSD